MTTFMTQETLIKHLLIRKLLKMNQNCKHYVCSDVTSPKLMGEVFATNPEIWIAPVGANMSSRILLQKLCTTSWSAVLWQWSCNDCTYMYVSTLECVAEKIIISILIIASH